MSKIMIGKKEYELISTVTPSLLALSMAPKSSVRLPRAASYPQPTTLCCVFTATI